jgi:glycine cleavage system transcriptional repressor
MTSHAILTAIGSDRPGWVDDVSHYIFDRGGNIEDSRMVNLRGQFAMMVLVGGSADVLARVQNDLASLAKSGLHAELRPAAAADRVGGAGSPALPYRLRGTGIDQAGMVHRVAHVLREMNVNIESLDTQLRPAPVTGSPMFEMELVLSVPKATPVRALRQRIGAVCDELNIDWELEGL